MAKIHFIPDNYTVECKDGEDLQDICENNGIDLPFSCKNGVCGTCLCRVKEGTENLNLKTEQEEITLDTLGADNEQRLACQCKVLGDIKIDF